MFNKLFAKKESTKEISLYSSEVSTLETSYNDDVLVKEKTKKGYDPVILQIHNEFETASEKLLKQANDIVNSTKPNVSEEKANLLKKHGFRMTKEVLEKNKIDEKIKLSNEQIETITYYKQNYPFNKFILPEQVEEICKKYNLVFGEVSDYKGFVPEKNLKEIDNFKLKDEDFIYHKIYRSIYGNSIAPASLSEYQNYIKENSKKEEWARINDYYYTKNNKLEICAPIHDMNTENKRITKGYKLENIPLDPVVLHPVRGGGYLVLTAWGDEASDPIIQNEIFN